MSREAYEQVTAAPHKAKLSHEIIAAAASYEPMKVYNNHRERHGENVSHGSAKQIMAAATGAFIDRMIETKGLDAIDHRTKNLVEEHAKKHYRHHHGY